MALQDILLELLRKICTGMNYQLALTVTAVSFGSGFQHVYCSDAVFLQSINHLIKEFIEKTLADYEGYLKDRNEIGILALQFLSQIYSIGAFVGCLLIPVVVNNIGRKSGLLWNNGTIIISVLLQSLSKSYGSYGMLFFGRFLIGLSTWLGTGISLIYIVEISPATVRGILGASYSFAMSIAILATQILVSPNILGNEANWPWLFVVCALPVLCQITVLPFCPETPKIIIIRRNDSRALSAAAGTNSYDIVENVYEVQHVSVSIEQIQPTRAPSMFQMLKSQILITPSVICCVLMIGHYFGAVGVLSFLPGDMTLVSSVCVISTGICMLLVDQIGRKKLLMIGIIIMSIMDVVLFTCFLWMEIWNISIGFLLTSSVVSVMIYVIAFSLSLGTIPWFLVCELSTQSTRPQTTALAFSCYWIAHWCFQIFLWILKDFVNAYFLLLFSFLTLVLAIFIHKKLPETHGESVHELSAKRSNSYITSCAGTNPAVFR